MDFNGFPKSLLNKISKTLPRYFRELLPKKFPNKYPNKLQRNCEKNSQRQFLPYEVYEETAEQVFKANTDRFI